MTADFNLLIPITERFIDRTVLDERRDAEDVSERIEDFETKFLKSHLFDLTYPELVWLIDMVESSFQMRFGDLVGE